jgi:kynurenine formamidase
MFKKAAIPLLLTALALAQSDTHSMTKSDFDRLMTELSNWGRWGKDDQIGALNLITPAKRKQAVALVKDGVSVSLAHDVLKEKADDNPNPFEHTMRGKGADGYSVFYHGYAHTHMDALYHQTYQGKMYNGFSTDEVTSAGSAKDSIISAKTGIVTRAVLFDIAKLKGVDYLEPGTPIYPEDLDAWEKKAGVKLTAGDVILIHTGRWKRRAEKGPWVASKSIAGLHISSAKWLHDRGVAIVGSDGIQDVVPSQVEGVNLPIHQLVIVAMGAYIWDNCDLEEVSAEAAKRNRYAFLVTASPLAVPGGSGSPLNPIATF